MKTHTEVIGQLSRRPGGIMKLTQDHSILQIAASIILQFLIPSKLHYLIFILLDMQSALLKLLSQKLNSDIHFSTFKLPSPSRDKLVTNGPECVEHP